MADGSRPPVDVVQAWFPEEMTEITGTGLPGWLPVYLELKNTTAKPVEVRIEGRVWSAGGRSRDDFRRTRHVEVNPGPAKKVFLYLWYPEAVDGEFGSRLEVRVFSGEKVRPWVREYRIGNGQTGGFRPLPVLVTGREAGEAARFLGGLGQSSALAGIRPLPVAADPLQERMLPDDPLGYQSVRALVLCSLDEKQIEEVQIEAIRSWVYLGGVVILVPSREGEIFSTRLARTLLPAGALGATSLEEGFTPRALAFLGGVAREKTRRASSFFRWRKENEAVGWKLFRIDAVDARQAPPTRVIASIDPESDEESLESAPWLYHEVSFGAGRIGILSVDGFSPPPDATGNWRTFSRLLWTLILHDIRIDATTRSNWNRTVATVVDGGLVDFVKAGLSPELGIWFIGGLIVVYLLLVGPGIYYLLRRLNRLPWVVWLQPTVVVVYVGLIFLVGYLTRGVLTQTRTLSVLHWQLGEALASKESYLGIFSSEDCRYRVSATSDRWFRPIFANRREVVEIDSTRREEGIGRGGTSIHDFRLDIWQTGVFASLDLVPMEGVLELEEGEVVAITNRTPLSISRGFYVPRRRTLVPTGPLSPGGRISLDRSALERVVDAARLGSAAGRDGDNGVADPLEGDVLTGDVVRRILDGDLFDRRGADIVFIGLLDRRDSDFEVSPATSLTHRTDLLVVSR